jgi:pimeloyl-ACP methyl ester carboxylesterase
MKRTLALLLVLFVALTTAAAEPVQGLWFGTLSFGAKELRLGLRIAQDADGLTGTLDSLDQGSGEIPLSDVTFTDGTLRFAIPKLGASFEGKLDGNALRGTWSQRGLSLPLSFESVRELPAVRRPQVPKAPYPYAQEEVVATNAKANVTLAGTLTLPPQGGPVPAVVLISGSGPQDRDQTIFGHKPFLVWADHLTRSGIAVLRVDDRGVGKSTGKREEATTSDYADDVLACVALLKTRKEIDPKRIGLIGHSEGGLIAPIAATRSKDIAFIILLAAPGLTGEEIVNLQSHSMLQSMGANEEQLAAFGALQRTVIGLAKTTADEAELRTKLKDVMQKAIAEAPESARAMYANLDGILDAQIKRLNSPWYRWFLAYDPRPVLRKVTVPILAVNGTKDIQVSATENLAAIRAAAPHATIVEVPGVNHLLQTAATGALTEYATIEETIAPVVLKVVGDWIEKQNPPAD